MRITRILSLLAVAVTTAACFHQVVNTGRSAGTTVVEKPWTSTWLWGLVPAEEINVAAQCPNGVATIETQQSFLNGLVGALTLGIYSPQEVRITCASAGTAGTDMAGARELRVAEGASIEARVAAVRQAIAIAEETHQMVVVRY